MRADTTSKGSSSGTSSKAVKGRTTTLILLTIIAAFNTIDRQVLTILTAPIKAEFQLSDSEVGALGLIYGILFALGAAPLAVLAQRTSRKTVLASCMALFSASTAFAGLASSYAMLLLSRLGVAVGECGTSAPSQSIIADSYAQEERTFALSIFNLAPMIGGAVAFLGGGWITAWYGWRATFLVLGIPGVVIGLIAWFLIREPVAGESEHRPVASEVQRRAATFGESIRYLFRTKSYVQILISQGFWALFTLAYFFWIPHYLVRAHGLSLQVIGTGMALTLIPGAVGVLALGWITQKLQLRDIRWLMGIPAIAAFVATPSMWLLLTTPSLSVVAATVIPPVFVSSAILGLSISAAQAVSPVEMRTVTAGILQVVIGVVGMGLGPFLPGVVSDLLEPRFGELSIRYSLLLFSLLWLWAGVHFFLASRHLKEDIARAEAHNTGEEIS